MTPLRAAAGPSLTPPIRGFRVAPFGVGVVIVTDCAATAEALERYVVPWCARRAVDGAVADRIVEVRRAADGRGLEVVVDGEVVSEAAGPLATIAHVQHAVDEAVVSGQRELAVVHGGVVAHGDRVILLPGSSGAGKSTLVAELVRRGGTYFSDEYAFIDPAGRVHPYPRTLLLRDRSGAIWPRLAADLPGAVGREAAMPVLVVAMRYQTDAELALERVSQGEAVLLLLRNTPQAIVDRPWILGPLERAAAAAACYTGVRGAAADAAAAILRLADSPS